MRIPYTRTPESLAASALPPAAYMYLPGVVRARMTPSTRTATTMSQIEVFTPTYSVRASVPNEGRLKRTTRLPFVMRLATPLTMKAIASVAISELMRRNVVTMPLTRPTSAAAPTPTTIASQTL